MCCHRVSIYKWWIFQPHLLTPEGRFFHTDGIPPQRDVTADVHSVVAIMAICSIYGCGNCSSKSYGFDPPDSFFHTILLQKQI